MALLIPVDYLGRQHLLTYPPSDYPGLVERIANMLYEQQRIEMDSDDRMHLLSLIQESVAREMPYLWLAQDTEFRVWRSWLQGDGLTFNPMHDIYFYHVYKVGFTDPVFSDPLRFYLIVGISAEIVIIITLIVYRYGKRIQQESAK